MAQTAGRDLRWTTADLEVMPDNGDRYEIIEGELYVTRAPHWRHQAACLRVASSLDLWSQSTGAGRVVVGPGVIFGSWDSVIPDVVWIDRGRFEELEDGSGHFAGAPDLVVEVLSAGVANEQRDREVKLKLYSKRGVREYWIVDWRGQQVEVYRREQAVLVLQATLLADDELTSSLLPDYRYLVRKLFV